MADFDTSARETVAKAEEKLGQHRYSEALQVCTRALARGTDDPRLRLVAAHALLAQGLLNRARQEAQQVLRLDPGEAEAHRLLADIAQSEGQSGTAAEHLHCVLQLAPDDEHSRSALEALSRFGAGATPGTGQAAARVTSADLFLQRSEMADDDLSDPSGTVPITDSMLEELPHARPEAGVGTPDGDRRAASAPSELEGSEPEVGGAIDDELLAQMGSQQETSASNPADNDSAGWAPGRRSDAAAQPSPAIDETLHLPAMDEGDVDDDDPTRMHDISSAERDISSAERDGEAFGASPMAHADGVENHDEEVDEDFGEPTRVAAGRGGGMEVPGAFYPTHTDDELLQDDGAFEDFGVEPASAPRELTIPASLAAHEDLPYSSTMPTGAGPFDSSPSPMPETAGRAPEAAGPAGIREPDHLEPAFEADDEAPPDSMMSMLAGQRAPAGRDSRPQAASRSWPPADESIPPADEAGWDPLAEPLQAAHADDAPIRSRTSRQAAMAHDDSLERELAAAGLSGPQRARRGSLRLVLALTISFAIGAGGFYGYLVYSKHKQLQAEWSKLRAGLALGTYEGLRQAKSAADRVLAKRKDDGEAWAAVALCDAAVSVEFGEDRLEPAREMIKRCGKSESEWRTAAEGYLSLIDDPALAVGYLKKGAQIYPDSALLRFLHAKALAATGSLEESAAEFQQLFSRPGDYPAARVALADLLAAGESGRDKATELLDSVLSKYPQHPNALIVRARVRAQKRTDLDGALADAHRVSVELRDRASRGQIGWAHLVDAQIERARGQVQQMSAALDAAIASPPCCDANYHHVLASELLRLYRYAEALVQMRAALKWKPKEASYLLRIASILLTMNRPIEAQPYAEATPSHLPKAKLLKGRLALALGRFRGAETALREAATHQSTALAARVYLARVHARRRQFAEAASLLAALAKRHPKVDLIPQTLGAIRLWAEDYPAAQAALKKAWRLNALDPLTPTLLAYVSMDTQDSSSAHKRFKVALVSRPDYTPAHIGLAELLRRNRQLDQAHAQAERVSENDRQRAEYQALRARLAMGKGNFDQAEAAITAAEKVGARRALVGRLRGELRAARGEYTKALPLLQKAYRGNRKDIELAATYGHALHSARRMNDAYDVLQEAIRLDPGHPLVLLDLGNIAISDGEMALALKRFNDALSNMQKRQWPKRLYARVYTALGRSHLRQDDTGRAMTNLQDAIDHDAQAGEPNYLMGRTYDKLDRPERAVPYYKKAIDLGITVADARLRLGQAYVRLGHTDQAQLYLKQCVEQAPKSAAGREAARILSNLSR